VIGFVLSPIAEKKLGAGLQASSGSWLPLISEPFSLVCCLLALVMLCLPFWQQRRARAKK
jgi:TctA family transporter